MDNNKVLVVRLGLDDEVTLEEVVDFIGDVDGVEILGIEYETEKVPQNEPVDDPFRDAARRMTR